MMPWANMQDALARMRKDSPVAGDTHIAAAVGGDRKKKKKPGEKDVPDEDVAHLPVTGMTLAAQQITGQKKPGMGKFAEVLKVDEGHGLVLGWAIVCKQGGEDYYDLQNDHIPEDSMLAATVDFMHGARTAKEMHSGDGAGSVLFAFPMTSDIAKAFGVETETTGLMIAMKPDSEETLGKFRDGIFTGFSIGGLRLEDEDVV
jgi:hypothetical protein